MKLTLRLQILPTEAEKAVILATMERFNEAANLAAEAAFQAGVFSQPSVHKLAYREIRERFGLSAQMAVRAIGKAVEVFKRDKSKRPTFKPRGAVTYDQRILSFKGMDRVSIWTLNGRLILPMVFGEHQAERFDRLKGQCDLVHRDGKFFLYATIDLPEPPPSGVKDFLGVDLGIVNIAADSDGNTHCGAAVEKVRRRHHKNRRSLQKKGTKGAKKRLRKLAGREARFRRHQNHVVSKTIVANAKGTERGIVLEDLKGIRERTTVSRKQRARHSGWSFFQLRSFVEYKASLLGVPVILVDPRNTSRTCSACGHCEKANRRNQSEFRCLQCGYTTNADFNAARNLRDLGLGRSKPPSKLAGPRVQPESPRL